MPRRLPLYLATVAVMLLAMGVLALAAELYLRSFVFDPRQPYVRTPGWEIVVRTSEQGTPGVSGESHIKINRLGLRGDLPGKTSSPALMTMAAARQKILCWTIPIPGQAGCKRSCGDATPARGSATRASRELPRRTTCWWRSKW
jgi:hypothetical protein